MRQSVATAIAAFVLFSSPAEAFDWVVSNVRISGIETSYMPGLLKFQIDGNGGSSCPAGTWLNFTPDGNSNNERMARVNAVLAVLLTAKSSGSLVSTGGANVGCAIAFAYIQ